LVWGSLSSSFRGLAHPGSTSTGSPMWGARLEIDDALTFTVPSARVDVANP
jgi:hypothetical protein